ncbi:MAG: homocysteine S-methyltransferase family protein [Desulfovibrionaceae bacterium]|nr:homocysteine S-methyltransferase family protein [Desulfovibrionaceae bacterium]
MSMIRHLLKEKRRLFVDGATGTMLQALGMPAGINPARFCLERPDVVRDMHRAYAEAGADILLTATFGGSSYKLPPDLDPVAFNMTMARQARAVADEMAERLGRPLFVAGDMGPSGHFIKPLGDLEPEELLGAFREQVRGLVKGGVDLLFVETQFDLAEVRAIVAAAHQECDLPVFASMTFEDGVSLTGSSPEIFAVTMSNMGVDAVGVNCGAGPEQMLLVAERLLAACDLPVFAEPNAGLPELVNGETVFRLGPAPFAEKTALFAERGVQILGGCCGTTPEHITALRQAVLGFGETAHGIPRPAPGGIGLTSRSSLVRMGGDNPLVLIGERVNPTGKKLLSAEFQAGKHDLALRYAAEQVESGTPVLDVNVGAPGVPEETFLPALVRKLVARHGTPLCLDSSNVDALIRSVPWHPGSALVNSISGEPGRMEKLGPLCRLWGSPFVLLPLEGRRLPASAHERVAVLENLLARAEALHIPRHLILVDVLVLTAASDANAPRACLDTIRWCVDNGLPTTMGLSNISFGLPARDLVNSGFLLMAAAAGLSSCIGNPGNARLREALDTANVLLGRDPQADRFIARYADWKASAPASAAADAGKTREESLGLEDAVIRGDKDSVVRLVEAELAAGADPFALVRERLIPAITEVGGRYERKEYFLPQLLRSAETMQAAFARVRPLLEERRDDPERPVIVLATVEGDIHDIGKNIVALLLGNHGYDVVDLGKDVTASRIVDEASRCGASVIGLSALMTTTMPRMEDTVKLVRQRNLACRVMVGGAVVTPEYAASIGAHGYAADAVEAVRVAARLLSGEAGGGE